MIRRALKRSEYEESPYKAWNAYVDIIAVGSVDSLSEVQRHAHFAFWYDTELQNGGHMQYFENCAVQHLDNPQHLDATLRGLKVIGADRQRDVLSRAAKRWNQHGRRRIHTVEEYVTTALEGEFDDFDREYYECRPEVTDLLKAYLDLHFDEFIELT